MGKFHYDPGGVVLTSDFGILVVLDDVVSKKPFWTLHAQFKLWSTLMLGSQFSPAMFFIVSLFSACMCFSLVLLVGSLHVLFCMLYFFQHR